MENLKTLKNIDVEGRTILYRAPYDIGTKTENGIYVIKDTSRIESTLKTIEYLLEKNCRIVIVTYVKRPEGKIVEELRTKPHAKALSELLKRDVIHMDECVGEKVVEHIKNMQGGDIVMLENTRFHPEEDQNDSSFAKKLTEGCDLIVFDGFPQAHRENASTTGILEYLPAVIGFYFEQEISTLNKFLETPINPMTLIIGGVKAETKIPVIDNFIDKADHILIGGRCAIDPLIKKYKENPKVAVAKLTKDTYDINLESIEYFKNIIDNSKQIIWAGPIGMFEDPRYSFGTQKIISAIKRSTLNGAVSLVAGGDTIEALKAFGTVDDVSYISLAGGATLEYLSGKKLPVIRILEGKN